MRRNRIVIADGLAIFRSGVSSLLARESDFDVVEAATFEELMREVGKECPDIALIDFELPPRGGVAAAAALAERCPTYTVMWSFEPTRTAVLSAIRAGASGFLHKEISPAGLVRSLRGVVHGEAPLARDLAALMIEAVHGLEERGRARERASVLSVREREVLDLVSRGARNRAIAETLEISEFTVKRHVQNILQKLGLPSRRAAAAFYESAFEPDPGEAISRTA